MAGTGVLLKNAFFTAPPRGQLLRQNTVFSDQNNAEQTIWNDWFFGTTAATIQPAWLAMGSNLPVLGTGTY